MSSDNAEDFVRNEPLPNEQGTDDPWSLWRVCRSSRNPLVRGYGVKLLEKIGPAALPVLKEALKDRDEGVRAAAENAIRRIESDRSG